MQIRNFVLSVSNGAVAVEMSEREALRLAESILSARFYRSLPGDVTRKLGDIENDEITVDDQGVLHIGYTEVLEDGEQWVEVYASNIPEMVSQVHALRALRLAAREYH